MQEGSRRSLSFVGWAVLALVGTGCGLEEIGAGPRADAGVAEVAGPPVVDATLDALPDGALDVASFGDAGEAGDAGGNATDASLGDATTDVGAADAGQDAGMPCVPMCAGLRCGLPDGCGASCALGGGCVDNATFNVPYGDPSFAGICQGPGKRNTIECDVAAKRACQARGFVTGFPTQTSPGGMTIACFTAPAAESPGIPLSSLTTLNTACTASNLYSVYCQAASDAYCVGHGYAGGGFGPTEVPLPNVEIGCFPSPMATRVSAAFAAVYQGKCASPNYHDALCDAYSDAYCRGLAYAVGKGPQEIGGTPLGVIVLCLK